ncbi:MAG: DUF2442 domain-containing protein [Symploca sp. SIO1B1]|nr:DUF2442 domain-containing protein [Symploca sp. SIO1C2]NER97326.1 DUF2442 domain-containing protein [Symploca sp. SIO1B1]
MLYQITKVTVEEERKLRIFYTNESSIIVDFHPIIQKGGILTKLADPEFFAQVSIGERGRYIQWPGEIEFCADALWFESHPKANDFQQLEEKLLN